MILVGTLAGWSCFCSESVSSGCPSTQRASPHWLHVRGKPGASQSLNSHFTSPGSLWWTLGRSTKACASLSWTFGIWVPFSHRTALAGSGLKNCFLDRGQIPALGAEGGCVCDEAYCVGVGGSHWLFMSSPCPRPSLQIPLEDPLGRILLFPLESLNFNIVEFYQSFSLWLYF